MAEMVIDKAGKVSVDRAEDMLIVDGVRISMDVLPHCVNHQPDRWFRAERNGTVVLVHMMTGSLGGAEAITAERVSQVNVHGWTPYHDDQHRNGELIAAARAYAWVAFSEINFGAKAESFFCPPNDWPQNWDPKWFKPSDNPIRNLEKAGALIAAEIDRLQRKESANG